MSVLRSDIVGADSDGRWGTNLGAAVQAADPNWRHGALCRWGFETMTPLARSDGQGGHLALVRYCNRPFPVDGVVTNPGFSAYLADTRNAEHQDQLIQMSSYWHLGGEEVVLGHKLHQYEAPYVTGSTGTFPGGWYLGSPRVPTVEAWAAYSQHDPRGDTFWDAEPLDYGLHEYTQGWGEIARGLRNDRTPYSMYVNGTWFPGSHGSGWPALPKIVQKHRLWFALYACNAKRAYLSPWRDGAADALRGLGVEVVRVD